MKICEECKEETTVYFMCDEIEDEDKVWCEGCFEKTPCGQDAHGEGCPTKVFDDGKD